MPRLAKQRQERSRSSRADLDLHEAFTVSTRVADKRGRADEFGRIGPPRHALFEGGGVCIVAAPAIDEPFGLTVPEAGSYRRPVVVARSGALP